MGRDVRHGPSVALASDACDCWVDPTCDCVESTPMQLATVVQYDCAATTLGRGLRAPTTRELPAWTTEEVATVGGEVLKKEVMSWLVALAVVAAALMAAEDEKTAVDRGPRPAEAVRP